ncbi:MAG: type 4a pilus biogenesis protein PilO [Desulfobacterales bacterium]|nr:type 4a pilus biogenesis protein PilO [Desulfobacterales bacterium]
MKKPKLSLESLAPFFDKVEKLSKLQRILIYGGVFLVLVGSVVYFLYLPKMTQIDSLKKEQTDLEGKLAVARKNARQLPGLKKKMAAAESRYQAVMKALPEKEEIPSLLTSVSQSGTDAGLEFLLFQPKAEVRKDFYAEIPVSIRVEGSYHNVAMFFDRVAGLSRIVNIENIVMAPKGADSLTTTCTAVTYKFVEPVKTAPKKKGRRK